MKNFLTLSLIVLFTISFQNCSRNGTDNIDDIDESKDVNSETTRRPNSPAEIVYVIIDYVNNVSFFQRASTQDSFEMISNFPIYRVYFGIENNLEVWEIASDDIHIIEEFIVPTDNVVDYDDTSVFDIYYTSIGYENIDDTRDLLIDYVAVKSNSMLEKDIIMTRNCCESQVIEDVDGDWEGVIDHTELVFNKDLEECH